MTNLVQMQTVYQGPTTLLADWPDMPIWPPTMVASVASITNDFPEEVHCLLELGQYCVRGMEAAIAGPPGSTYDPAGALARFGYPRPGNPGIPPKQIAAALKANEMAVFHDPRDVITDPVQQLSYPSEISDTSFDMKVAGTPPHNGPYAPWNKMVATFTPDLPDAEVPDGTIARFGYPLIPPLEPGGKIPMTGFVDAGIGTGAATGSEIGFTPSAICLQQPCWPSGFPWPCPDSGCSGLSGHQKGKMPAIEMAIDPYFPFPYPL